MEPLSIPMTEGHYHFRAKLISRSEGRAICAAAAYRSGEKIHDERYGQTFDYTPRTSIYATEIRAPDHAPDWMKNRSQLWNGVEAYETRRNSVLAREFEVSIPAELPPELRQEAIRRFVDSELVSRGMVADIAYHDFTGQHQHNPHAHILVTTREITGDTFSKHKTREWDSKKTLWRWRKAWAQHANQALEKARSQTRIDHRSHRARGIDRPPVNESRGEWYERQREITATKKHLEAVNIELAALQKEQERQQQERMDALIQFGNELARDRARHHQEQRQKREPSQTPPAPYTHTPPEPSPGIDEKALIKQLLDEQTDRERDKPRVIRRHPDEETTPARGESLEQQTAHLKEAIAAFDAELETLKQTQRQPQEKTRRTPDPHPPKEPEPKPEKRHERGIGR